jgi:hypothetical protein
MLQTLSHFYEPIPTKKSSNKSAHAQPTQDVIQFPRIIQCKLQHGFETPSLFSAKHKDNQSLPILSLFKHNKLLSHFYSNLIYYLIPSEISLFSIPKKPPMIEKLSNSSTCSESKTSEQKDANSETHFSPLLLSTIQSSVPLMDSQDILLPHDNFSIGPNHCGGKISKQQTQKIDDKVDGVVETLNSPTQYYIQHPILHQLNNIASMMLQHQLQAERDFQNRHNEMLSQLYIKNMFLLEEEQAESSYSEYKSNHRAKTQNQQQAFPSFSTKKNANKNPTTATTTTTTTTTSTKSKSFEPAAASHTPVSGVWGSGRASQDAFRPL